MGDTAGGGITMANYRPQACAWCGMEFTPTHPSNIYCAPPCRDGAHLQRARKNNLKYRQKNRDRINKQKRKHYQANREAINANKCAQYAVDPTRQIERARKYREENKEAISERHRMARTIEHLTPIHRGGRHDLDNVDFAHWSCNASKGAKTLEKYREWRASLQQAS